jgi:hypothetical protein
MTAKPRPPTILDGIIFVAAIAVALAIGRGKSGVPADPFELNPPTPSAGRVALGFVQTGILWTKPFAISVTATLVILRMIPPRPRLRRIARQPGFIACAAAVIAMAVRLAEAVLYCIMGYLTRSSSAMRLPAPPFARRDDSDWLNPTGRILYDALVDDFPGIQPWMIAVAIVAAWFVLWANGKWRPEPSWLDRLGRLMGAYWIAVVVATSALNMLWRFVDL